VSSPEEKEEKKDRKQEALRRRRQERRLYDENMVKTFFLGHIKDPCREKLRDAIEKRVDSYSKSIVKTLSGLMHLAREMYRDVTQMETVDVPDAFFDRTCIRYLMLGTAEARRETQLVYALHENFAEFRSEATRYRGECCIYEYRAMGCLTNVRSLKILNVFLFMIRVLFALYPCLFREGIRGIIDGIKNDSQHERDMKFVEKKTSRWRKNEASVLRSII